jgi:hypothetical protein
MLARDTPVRAASVRRAVEQQRTSAAHETMLRDPEMQQLPTQHGRLLEAPFFANGQAARNAQPQAVVSRTAAKVQIVERESSRQCQVANCC